MQLFILRPVLVLSTLSLAASQYDGYETNGNLFEPNYPQGYKEAIVHHREEPSWNQEENDLDYHAHPKYSFDYSVKDPNTGDDKEHWETRDGDKVKGSYTLLETDGTKRVVEYEADDKNGFNAVVHKIGTPVEEEHRPVHYRHIHSTIVPVVRKATPLPAYEPPLHFNQGFEDGFVPIAGFNQ